MSSCLNDLLLSSLRCCPSTRVGPNNPLRGVRRWDRYVSRGTQLPFHALQTGYLQYHNTNVLYSALASAVHCSLRAIFVAVRSADRRLGLTERRKSNSAEDTVRHHPAFTHFVVCTTTDRNDISAGSSQRSPDISTLLQSPSALLAGCCNLQPTSQVEFARKEHSAEKSWWFAVGGVAKRRFSSYDPPFVFERESANSKAYGQVVCAVPVCS